MTLPDIPIMLMDTPAALGGVLETLSQAKTFAMDYEATPVEWWRKDYAAYTVAFSGRDPDGSLGSVVVPLWHPEHVWEAGVLEMFLARLATILANRSTNLIVHNFQYEGPVTYRLTGKLPWCGLDTMVAAQLLDENRLKALKFLGQEVLGWPDWGIDTKVVQPLDETTTYNGLDAAATLLL